MPFRRGLTHDGLQVLKRIAHGVTANVVAQLVIAVTQLAIVPALASHWGLQLYGWWILVSTIPSYLALTDLGFATAAGAEITMQIARGDRAAAIVTFQSAWTAVAALSMLVLIAALSLIWLLPDHFFGLPNSLSITTARTIVSLFVAYAIVALQGTIFLAGFRGIGLYALGVYSQAWIFLVEGVAVFLLGITGFSPLVVVSALLICRSAGVSVQGILLSRAACWLPLRLTRLSWSEARHLSKPSAAVLALTAAQITSLQGTVIAVGVASSAANAAVFSSIRTLTRVGVQLAGLVTRTLAPEYSTFSAQRKRRAQARIVIASLMVSAAILVPIALILASYGVPIVRYWTHDVIHVDWSFIWIMTAVMVIHGAWVTISNLLLAINRHEELAYTYLVLSVSSVGFAYLLAGKFGELGGGVSLLVLDAITAVLVFKMTSKHLVPATELLAVLRKDFRFAYNTSKLFARKLVSRMKE